LTSILLVEFDDRKLKRIDQRDIPGGASALERAENGSCATISGIAISLGFSCRARRAAFEVVSFSNATTAFASGR